MTPVNQPEHKILHILLGILTDDQRAESLLAKLQNTEKIIADFILVVILYEIATKTGRYAKGTIRNIALVTAGLIGYILSPIDVVPDAIPVAGQVDDWAAVAAVMAWYVNFVIDFAKDVVNQGVLDEFTQEMPPKIGERVKEACRAIAKADLRALMSDIERFYKLPGSATTFLKEGNNGSAPVSP